MQNPYADLPDCQFWRRSVSSIETFRLDPVVRPRFRVERHERVATAGSCFAQHISRTLSRLGFTYFVADTDEAVTPEERERRGFGMFSARYGNVYTARQLRQLFDEAFGGREPVEVAHLRADGRWVDAFRPVIEPAGFASAWEVEEARRHHLAHVRAVFLQADIFIFTLGLTEAWRSRTDGSVFPLAPGTVAGTADPERYEFVNFEVEEVVADMQAFLDGIRGVNPSVRVLLTVSPVPLIATYEDRHVLTSTTYSKSVLRVAADKLIRRNCDVDYFPSYEIITGSYAGGLYYENDFREVNSLGVAHAMRCFTSNYASGGPSRSDDAKVGPYRPDPSAERTICDEEMIDVIRR